MRNDFPSAEKGARTASRARCLAPVRRLGMRYFSLRALKRSPFDELKIDRPFVSGSDESGEDTQRVLGNLAAGAAA